VAATTARAKANVKANFFNWFAKGATCYLNRFDQVQFAVLFCKSFVLGSHISNVESMLMNYLRCEGGRVSLHDMFDEYVILCDGFQTLNKDEFKFSSGIWKESSFA
jgi:hypothetical protein